MTNVQRELRNIWKEGKIESDVTVLGEDSLLWFVMIVALDSTVSSSDSKTSFQNFP